MNPSTRMRKLLWIVSLFLAFLGSACAQTYEVSIIRSWARMSKKPLGSNNVSSPRDDETTFRNGSSYGIRLTLNSRGYYGHELGFMHTRAGLRTVTYAADGTRTNVETKVRIEEAFYNFLIYMMPRGERWRPYITGGLQAHQTGNPKIENWTGRRNRNYGFNYGAGIKFKLANHVLFRLDLRDYLTGQPYGLAFADVTRQGGLMRQQEASFGLALGF